MVEGNKKSKAIGGLKKGKTYYVKVDCFVSSDEGYLVSKPSKAVKVKAKKSKKAKTFTVKTKVTVTETSKPETTEEENTTSSEEENTETGSEEQNSGALVDNISFGKITRNPDEGDEVAFLDIPASTVAGGTTFKLQYKTTAEGEWLDFANNKGALTIGENDTLIIPNDGNDDVDSAPDIRACTYYRICLNGPDTNNENQYVNMNGDKTDDAVLYFRGGAVTILQAVLLL